MFTGIVQGMGEVSTIVDKTHFRQLRVRLPAGADEHLHIGASIANNGCCLTITAIHNNEVSFDLMHETLATTNLGQLHRGDKVNIERAARFGDEIGGHMMSGHIMTTTTINHIHTDEHNCTVWLALPEPIRPYIFSKGFIGLDGCSLTIGDVTDNGFNVHLIPETLSRTLFGQRRIGDIINIEIDAQTQAIVDTVSRVLTQQGRI